MATTNLGRVKPIHRGVYDPDFPYTPLDIVRYQGASYFCIKASQGNVPQDGEFFMAIVDGDLRYAQIVGGADANFAEAPQINGQSLDDRYQKQVAGKQVIYVDTFADLQALDTSGLVDGQQASVRGTTFAWSSSRATWAPVSSSINVKSFGAVGDGVTDDTAAFTAALGALNDRIHTVFIPKGEYSLTELVLPDGCHLVGAGSDLVVLRLSDSAGLAPLPADPTVTVVVQTYLPFIRTGSSGSGGASYSDVRVSDLTIDWNHQNANGYAACPLWIGGVRGFDVRRVRVVNQLPGDYDIRTSSGRGTSVFISYCEDGHVAECMFDGSASYEELGIRYTNRNITVERNVFAGKGPWRHNIEIASATFASNMSTEPENIRVLNNEFRLHGHKQDCISCHDSGTVIVQGNSFIVDDDLVDTRQSGVRCIVKKFDGNKGSLLVSGNTFDFLRVPSTVSRAFECVRTWADNCTVSNNFFRGRTDGFNESLEEITFYPWVGVGDGSKDHKALLVIGNTFELHQYTNTTTPIIIKSSGRGVTISGNTLNLVHPLDLGSSENGPIFIDINGVGSSSTESGNLAGRSVSVTGNTAYSPIANAIRCAMRFRQHANFIVATGNVMFGARDRIIDQTSSGTKYFEGNL